MVYSRPAAASHRARSGQGDRFAAALRADLALNCARRSSMVGRDEEAVAARSNKEAIGVAAPRGAKGRVDLGTSSNGIEGQP
jgi:hypothetical protein